MNGTEKPRTRDDLAAEERGQHAALTERPDEALECLTADRCDLAHLPGEAERGNGH